MEVMVCCGLWQCCFFIDLLDGRLRVGPMRTTCPRPSTSWRLKRTRRRRGTRRSDGHGASSARRSEPGARQRGRGPLQVAPALAREKKVRPPPWLPHMLRPLCEHVRGEASVHSFQDTTPGRARGLAKPTVCPMKCATPGSSWQCTSCCAPAVRTPWVCRGWRRLVGGRWSSARHPRRAHW